MSEIVTRQPPANLKEEDRAYFEHHFRMELDPASVRDAGRGVWLSNPQVLFTRLGRAYPPSVTYEQEEGLLGRRYFFSRRLLLKGIRLPGPAVLITDRHSRNYYHWHTEALPNLVNFLNSPLAKGDWQLLIPEPAAILPYVRQSLPYFLADADRIVFAKPKHAYSARKFIHCQKLMPYGHQELRLIAATVDVFDRALPSTSTRSGRKIYLQRSGIASSRRNIVNEAQVIALLLEYGYECIDFEQIGYLEQIQLCRETRFLISIHGAGLTNMMFMPRGSTVFEFKNRGDVNHFYFLASICGHSYYYQACRSHQRKIGEVYDHIGDLTVDIDTLRADIEQHHLY